MSLFSANENGDLVNIPTSIIDIDIIKEGFVEVELIKLLEEINIAQRKQKEIFFNLLKDSYLSTLNPEY